MAEHHHLIDPDAGRLDEKYLHAAIAQLAYENHTYEKATEIVDALRHSKNPSGAVDMVFSHMFPDKNDNLAQLERIAEDARKQQLRAEQQVERNIHHQQELPNRLGKIAMATGQRFALIVGRGIIR